MLIAQETAKVIEKVKEMALAENCTKIVRILEGAFEEGDAKSELSSQRMIE